MSRIGKLPIAIPAGVTVDIKDGVITVKGKLGELSQKYGDAVILEMEDGQLHVKPNEATAAGKPGAMHGLYRAIINNMVKGVSEGFETVQEFVGVGYKAEAKGQILEMALGFSHNIFMEMPPEIKIETINDKQLLGQVAAKIRSMRKPEPYKGKGIKFEGEVLRRKAGKAAGK